MRNPLPYNLHSHTSRCGHAVGEDVEYVQKAIQAGYEEMAFTDHVMLPGISQPGIRGEYSQAEEYFASVNDLRIRYQDQIKIHLGFEAEWYGDVFEGYYRKLLARPDFDLFLLGQHCYLEDGKLHWYASLPFEERLPRYQKDLLEAMASGIYTYVAHPDIYVKWHETWDEETRAVAEQIAMASNKYHMPLELNCVQIRSYPEAAKKPDTLNYPCPMFWDVIALYGCDVVIGVDAHRPEHYTDTDYDYIVAFAERHGLRLLKECPLKKK